MRHRRNPIAPFFRLPSCRACVHDRHRLGVARSVPMLRVLLSALLFWPALAPARGDTWREHPEWATEFSGRGVSGSIVVYDEGAQAWHVFDRARAESRYSPASTFKLFN